MHNFFIDYKDTPFLETSITATFINRLNWRAEILLTRNREAIEGKRILDLASHDGRFSYACLKLGAAHVTGVEMREHLIGSASDNLKKYGYGPDKFEFLQGDMFDYLSKFDVSKFDTILCFGFFYHTIKQVELLELIKALKPQYFILDTVVAKMLLEERASVQLLKSLAKFILFWFRRRKLQKMGKEDGLMSAPLTKQSIKNDLKTSYLEFSYEDPEIEGCTKEETGLIAMPSKGLIEMLFKNLGYDFKELKWERGEIDDWFMMEDYKFDRRVSYFTKLK